MSLTTKIIIQLTQEVFAKLVQLFDALVSSQHLPVLPDILEPPEHAHLWEQINSDENVGLVKTRGKGLISDWKLNEIRST